jgi:phospholipid transport system substrate-binding protein
MKKFLCALFLAFTSLTVAAQESPDALVKRVTDEVLDIIRKDKDIQNGSTQKAIDLVETKVLPNFNFQRMTALAVGKDWRKASPQQQQKLSGEFKTLLVRTYANALTGYKDQQVVYKPLKLDPAVSEVVVRTEIKKPGGQPIKLDYSLEKLADGWKVFDVVVADVSLVANYRGEFVEEVSKNGIDGLIQRIATRNHELEARAKGK